MTVIALVVVVVVLVVGVDVVVVMAHAVAAAPPKDVVGDGTGGTRTVAPPAFLLYHTCARQARAWRRPGARVCMLPWKI